MQFEVGSQFFVCREWPRSIEKRESTLSWTPISFGLQVLACWLLGYCLVSLPILSLPAFSPCDVPLFWYRRMVVEGGRNDTMLSNPSWWVTRWRDEKLLTTPRRHHKSPTGTVSMLPRTQLLDHQGQWYVDLNMNIRQSFTISWASLISQKDIYHCLPRPRWPKEQCLSSAELANTI